MNTKVIAKIDDQGRISIPNDLLELARFDTSNVAALCKCPEFENALQIRNIFDIEGHQVVAKVTFERKRIIFPIPFRDGIDEVEIFLYNNAIIIKENS